MLKLRISLKFAAFQTVKSSFQYKNVVEKIISHMKKRQHWSRRSGIGLFQSVKGSCKRLYTALLGKRIFIKEQKIYNYNLLFTTFHM